MHVSATPGNFDLDVCEDRVFEQVIRPTGLVDPEIEVRPAKDQVADLLGEIRKTIDDSGRVLVTTLTKRMAEDLTKYYEDFGIPVRYLHSDIDSLERVELLRDLRQGVFSVLVGINLLREGLDLPEVKLVAVMDADKEGFLRSRSSLIQVVGRAARNAEGRVLFYADSTSKAMKECMEETQRRRKIQIEFNEANGIVPKTIEKKLPLGLREIYGIQEDSAHEPKAKASELMKEHKVKNRTQLEKLIRKKTSEMKKLAKDLDFEGAAALRDAIYALKDQLMSADDDHVDS